MTSIVEVIQHYQRSIDSSQDNEARLLHCINKLYKLPIKVEHLQETGVGKTVNSLRKFNGEIGIAAKALVTKWKAMVAAEEEPMETNSQSNDNEHQNDANGDGCGTTSHEEEEDENHNRNSVRHEENSKLRNEEYKDKHQEKHKSRSSSSSNSHKESSKHSTTKLDEKSSKNLGEKQKSSSSKEKSGSSSHSSKHRENEREKSKTEHKSSKDHQMDRNCDKEKERHDKRHEEKLKSNKDLKEESSSDTTSVGHKSKSHSSSSKSKNDDKHRSSSSSKDKDRSEKHKSSTKDKEKSSKTNKTEHKSSPNSSTSKTSTKDLDSADCKRRRNSDNDTADFKSPQPKVAKLSASSSTPVSIMESSPIEEEAADDSFDSSMGANFDDVLGMLNVPVKKSKKSLKSPSTPSSSTSNTSKKDEPSQSKISISAVEKTNETRIAHSSKSSHSTPSTSKASNLKPDLLAPTTKLEPLDPSIALELPTISTNYRPMPLNQTVMDCVFNNSSFSSSSTKPVRTLSDAEAITHGISSKTIRTKIYSGIRTGQTFQVPSLFDMCIRILQKNIDALEYTGGVPFEVLKAVLERATPQQLYVFEEYNPYLMEDSDTLWQQHVSRSYRTKKRQENESWREMFIRCQEEDERRLSVLKDSIKASQKIATAPIRKTQLAFIDSMVKPPRNVIRKQEQFGTKAKLVATPAARVAALSNATPNAAKTGDQRLKVAATVRDHAQVSSSSNRPKKAPLMQKTLQFIRGRHKR